ncbi:MAG TPA: DUF2851 family protein [Victivallales bacterium]|nr:DUF2851 family protein [Victivallales bacterium]
MRQKTEEDIQFFWKKLKPGSSFTSKDGQHVKILSPGSWNFEEGPDFINAKFAIDEEIKTGNVEIHLNSSSWNTHGHSSDPRYGDVKLHVVLRDDLPNPVSPGIITVEIPASAKIANAKASLNMKFTAGKCGKAFSSFDDVTAHSILSEAGKTWMIEKAGKATGEIIERGFDDALVRRIFEAVGYKKNKDNFLELFDRVSKREKENASKNIEALIWGESGLLPDPTTKKVHPEMKELAAKIWKGWWSQRDESDKTPIRWIKSGVRPLNSPERRIAGLCMILRKTEKKVFAKINKIMKKSGDPKLFAEELIEIFTANDPLWNGWTNFRDKRNVHAAVIGEMRAVDIVINVVLPFLIAKFAIEKNEDSEKFCFETFMKMPRPQDNITTTSAAQKWFSPPSRAETIICDAASAQGAIFMMKRFCEKNSSYCPDCELLMELMKKR